MKTTGWWSMFLHPSVTLANHRGISSAPGTENWAWIFLTSSEITIPGTLLSVGIALWAV